MGAAKKRRPCPAVQREITPAECGENRLSRYACPDTCPFNPLAPANYDAQRAIEDRVDVLTMQRFARESPKASAELLEQFDSAASEGHGAHQAAVWKFFFEHGDDGRTFADRWRAAGLAGLNNDERILFEGKARMRVALLEIHRIIDAQTIEAVDLLEPKAPPLRMIDRSLAATAARFSTYLAWIYPTPHFWRVTGTAIMLSDVAPLPAAEIIDACVTHLGGPLETGAKRRWLAENFLRIDEALTATGIERRRRMFAQMDACFGTATYEVLASYQQCHAALAGDPATDQDELHADEQAKGFRAALVWFDTAGADSKSLDFAPGRKVLGRVLIGPKECRVEAMGAARLDELRAKFEARLGPRVRFVKERRDDIGRQVGAGDPEVNAKLVPPRLLENSAEIVLTSSRLPAPPEGVSLEEYQAMMLAEHRREFVDQPVPALDGATPRDAARNPALRPRLIELMKSHVRRLDEENLKSGRSDDINAMLRELGLVEIDFPPPPVRPRVEMETGEADADENTDEDDARPAEWSAGPLPDRPLDIAESIERLDAALQRFERAADAMSDLEASGATVLADMDQLTADWLSDDEFSFLLPQVLHVWFALVPAGPVPPLRYDAIAASFHADLDRMAQKGPRSAEAVMRILESTRQPHFIQLVNAGLLELANKTPKKQRPAAESLFIMAFALKALVEELDFALRR